MVKEFRSLNTKQKLVVCLEFFIGYLSPLLGCILGGYAIYKGKDNIYRNAPLMAAALALVLYVIDAALGLIMVA